MFKLSSSNGICCATAGTYFCIQSFIIATVLGWVKLSDINNWCAFPFIKCVQKFIFTEYCDHKLISAYEKMRYWFKCH